MRQSIHHHYEQLTERELEYVDRIFDSKLMYELAHKMGVPLAGDDRVERAVDAFARAVIESRPKVEQPELPSVIAAREAARAAREQMAADDEIDGHLEVHLALKAAGLL